ncbi:MAG: DUF1343 domain-containing protein [Pseudomonadota bacterium]
MLKTIAVLIGMALVSLLPLPAVGGEDAAEGGPEVRNGIDVLAAEDFAALAGARVGLITNHTGVDRRGRSTIRLLHDARNVTLVAVFSPEHGLEGKLDVEHIADSEDRRTGVRVLSLYGETRTPTPEMLRGIDTLVFDIQDIGTRFYTYISTMGNAMQAAAANDIRFVVLDRPNPIGGVATAGPVLDDDKRSFVGHHTIAVRHGMTVAELARMFQAELVPALELGIVPLGNWRRAMLFDETGLEWVNPSPNMRSLDAALLYPGIGLLETTNLSVGRGTATPFELLGAPWLDGERLAARIEALRIPGIRVRAVRFTPESSKFAGEQCSGIRFEIGDRRAFQPLALGFAIARELRLAYAETWDIDPYLRLLGNGDTFAAIERGDPRVSIQSAYAEGLAEFRARRESFLLYR